MSGVCLEGRGCHERRRKAHSGAAGAGRPARAHGTHSRSEDTPTAASDGRAPAVAASRGRQHYDLGNMMLVLAVRTDPERVYQRALDYFTPAELAEAFAATRGVASPTQLRTSMRKDPRDLLGTFRALAPPREPIQLQRWSVRRVGLALAILAVAVIAVYIGGQAFKPTGNV